MAKKTDGMFTAGKMGKEVGASPAKVKKAIESLALEPDLVYCGCNYWNESSKKKILKAVDKG